MRTHDNGTDESNNLHNQFTAYLVTAIRRKKIQYVRAKKQTQYYRQLEIPIETQGDTLTLQTEPDMTTGLPLLDQLENMKLRQSLKSAKERELYVFLSKALEGRSLAEIAVELGIGYNTVASVYYRMINRLIKELGGEDV